MGQVDASDVNESLGKSQGGIQSSSQVSGSQVSSQWSSQGESKEDFKVVDKDLEDNSKTVIQPFDKNFPGVRTMS